MAYAGRLDPMASGQLLVLIGDECKKQTAYHGLDKEYQFSVLLGVSSDTGDILGRLTNNGPVRVSDADLQNTADKLVGDITLPYPAYSSKTVEGIPLHTWAVTGKLDEIEIPSYTSKIYQLTYSGSKIHSGTKVYENAIERINSLPPVTDPKKSLGNDFRRTDVRSDWEHFVQDYRDAEFQIAQFTCACASGAYMRSLAEVIAKQCQTVGLAFSIHRTKIGSRRRLPVFGYQYWKQP